MPDLSPFGTNTFGVKVQPLDYSHPNSPTTKTYHGMTIAVNGKMVGRITSWQATAYSREGNHVYELSHQTWGRPVDYVPGRSTGYSLSVGRTEVWSQELERALGFPAVWEDLADQDRPFTAHEFWFKGSALYRQWQYSGCWFTERNEDAFAADGDAMVKLTGTINYVSRARLV